MTDTAPIILPIEAYQHRVSACVPGAPAPLTAGTLLVAREGLPYGIPAGLVVKVSRVTTNYYPTHFDWDWVGDPIRDVLDKYNDSNSVGRLGENWGASELWAVLPGSVTEAGLRAEYGSTTDPIDETPSEPSPRPTIDFSTSSREKARLYAQNLLDGSWHRGLDTGRITDTLTAVATGSTSVDALDLDRALQYAQRANLTRFGGSPMRREAGREVAHLQHIVHAVLQNAIERGPVYQPGERSPALREARAEASRLRERLAFRTEQVEACWDGLAEAAKEVELQGALRERAEAHLAAERRRSEAIIAQARKHKSRSHEVERQRDVLSVTLLKAFDLLDEAGKARLHGYWDGVEDVMPS